MPPKKKLSKKEKARLEAEQAELLRIEKEKERQLKMEEECQRRQIEFEQAKRRQKIEMQENKKRRTQLRKSMVFFDEICEITADIRALVQEDTDWERYMRCNGLPNANSPSDLRRYIHQWRTDVKRREQTARNWLLDTDERTLLTQDLDAPNLSRQNLRLRQGNAGDMYAQRVREVLGVLSELDEAIVDKKKTLYIIADLKSLKMEIRMLLNEHLDEFTYKIMSNIDRDMDIDRKGVYKHLYNSEVYKSHFWTFSKDAQISANPKRRLGEQASSNDIEFPAISLQISLPLSVELRNSALRALWLNYDHFSDYCASFQAKRPVPTHINILDYTKKEWRIRKNILQNMLENCTKDSPLSTGVADHQDSLVVTKRETTFDVDKIYAEYEEELNKTRHRLIGPESYGLDETDVNLRKYRIIGGVYRIDYLETPQQDKRLNERSFIRTIATANHLSHKIFYQSYKPPPPPKPGVRRLPEEIEAEIRMVEAALDKLVLVTLNLPDSVIWFEPPVVCRWETHFETLESNLTNGAQAFLGNTVRATATITPSAVTPISTTANDSPFKGSPFFLAKLRKQNSQMSATIESEDIVGMEGTVRAIGDVREVTDFDLLNIPHGTDIYGLLKHFVVPRLPPGFCLRWEKSTPVLSSKTVSRQQRQQIKKNQRQGDGQHLILIARHERDNINEERKPWSSDRVPEVDGVDGKSTIQLHQQGVISDFLNIYEPHELFPPNEPKRLVKFSKPTLSKHFSTLADNVENVKNCPSDGDDHEVNGIANNGVINKVDLEETGKANKMAEKRTYMFSKLLKDLDRLGELQLPLRTEALEQISAKISSPPPVSGSPYSNVDTRTVAVKTEVVNGTQAIEAQQLSFSDYPDFSPIRDLEAKSGTETKNKDINKIGEEISTDDDTAEEYDDGDGCDDIFLLASNQENMPTDDGSEANSMLHNEGEAFQYRGSQSNIVPTSSDTQQLLGKQFDRGQNSSDGKKYKDSNLAALTQGKWSIRDIHDVKFNEEKLSLQFRTGRLGIFGLALNRYSNMPYQTWEIKPDLKSPGSICFSLTASIISLDMNITSAGYCVNNFQGGSTPAIDEMLGKTLSLTELKSVLISAAVDIFPEPDTFCYTEGTCEKNVFMEMHLYACLSTLVQSHNFNWSRWNLLAGSRTIVLLMRELVEGKKVPYYSTLMVTPLKTAIIECTEVSPQFSSTGIAGMEYYADLYQLSQVYALPSSLEKQKNMDPTLRENMAKILMAIRPLSFC